MARLARLALAGQAHLVLQLGHSGQAVFADDSDRRCYLDTLHHAAATAQVAVHAYALLDNEVRLLLTPLQASSLAQLMQALGRRYVSAYNRRHGRSGTLWDGRYRCAVVQDGATRLSALLWVDAAEAEPVQRTDSESSESSESSETSETSETFVGPDAPTQGSRHTSAVHRSGGTKSAWLVDPPEYWALGNTPFEREVQYSALLSSGVIPAQAQALRRAAWGGWALGSPQFVVAVAEQASRPALPRPRGRPRRAPA